MLDSGQLTITPGRLGNSEILPDGVAVTIKERRTQTELHLQVDRVINCTGVAVDYHRSEHPLISNLRSQGLISPDQLGLGLNTEANGALLSADGKASNLLYTIGTPRLGDLWETIAVPELRGQAQALAVTLLESLPVRVRPIPVLSSREQTRTLQSALLFRQLFDPETSTYTYLIADRQTGDAVLVDTVLEQVDRDLQVLNGLKLKLRFCLETHLHADHITGAGKLRLATGCEVIVPQNAAVSKADLSLTGGETLEVGGVVIETIATPGHTDSHIAYLINKTHLLTGDALLIGGCGRTDFQSGDAGTLYDVITQNLFSLPEDTLVYPAHDYKGRTVSTIGEEKYLNPRFADRTREEFIAIMNNLNLSYPKKMNIAVPANEYCGDFIPVDALDSSTTNNTPDREKEEIERMVAANAEIYNDYIAMYI
jgi:glyoxylase-like metal-dependent hydrolase (beta-lactamase superfamily II)